MNLTFLINKIIKSSPLIVWTLALLLVLLQGHLFLVGFRLSADDVMYHARFMDGTASMIDFIYSSAIFQGRVGNYLNSPLLLVGAYYADQAFINADLSSFHSPSVTISNVLTNFLS